MEQEPPEDDVYEDGLPDRPDLLCMLIHTEGMRIVMEWRTPDVFDALDRSEISLEECIQLVDDLRSELEVYREHGHEQAALPNPYRQEKEE